MAMGAGGIIGARLVYLLVAVLVGWFGRKQLVGGRLMPVDAWLTLPALLLLIYLVYVCNFG